MIFIVAFDEFNKSIEDAKENGNPSAERIHYLRTTTGYDLYFKNYLTRLSLESIINSGLWESEEQFVMSYLGSGREVIGVKEGNIPSFKIVQEN